MLALYVKVTGDTSILARAIPLAEVSFFMVALLVY
jgi:cellobiose phosphorylase